MRRMLIVEDEPRLRNCLQQFFAARGFVVAAAFSGEEAVEEMREHSADVVLLDIVLPGLSGLEVLKRIKQLRPRARVIMVSALDAEEVREAAREYGADAYILKPFDFSDTTWFPAFAVTDPPRMAARRISGCSHGPPGP
ncbi:MAG: response regulator [Candidatus Omnitrophica bacterium]|nr:response regulator [Candidatus Omnitrophota bacterium]MBI3021922.1 response regulator [Candidatus Omnitrophota bacterium]MBI3083950.1 response regulator [Candidatus Omnitrophota bacterium]